MIVKLPTLKIITCMLFMIILSGCASDKETQYQSLKSVQVFHTNSGSNYLFENSKTMEEKHGEQN